MEFTKLNFKFFSTGIFRFILFYLLIILILLLISQFFVIPEFVEAQEIPNPIKADPAGSDKATVIDIVFAVFIAFSGVIGMWIFGFMIINAFKLIISRGNEESITIAKQGLTGSVTAFIIVIFAFSLVSAVSKIFGGRENVDHLASRDTLELPIRNIGLGAVFETFFTGVLGVTLVAATLMIVYSGIKMITAHGNEEQITSAKTILKWAVVGVALTALSFAILKGLDTAFVGGGG